MPNNIDMGGFANPGIPVKASTLGAVLINTPALFSNPVIDVQVNSTSQMHVTRDGTVRVRGNTGGLSNYASFGASSQNPMIYRGAILQAMFDQGCTLVSSGYYGISSGAPSEGGSDCRIYRDAAATINQRNGTNAQTFRVTRSYSDSSNYSWLTHKWNTSTAVIHAEGAGTGSDGSIAFNDAALATNATVGFIMIPSCAGVPSGTPADIPTGQSPIVYNSTDKKLAVWDGAAWVQTAALT